MYITHAYVCVDDRSLVKRQPATVEHRSAVNKLIPGSHQHVILNLRKDRCIAVILPTSYATAHIELSLDMLSYTLQHLEIVLTKFHIYYN